MSRFSLTKQVGVLTLLTAIFVTPYLFLKGTNIVTHTYAFGSNQFWLGLSPYVDPNGAGDWFKYSPLFAYLYSPFALLKSSVQAGVWGITNMFFFWLGVSVWFPWSKLESKWLLLGFVLCSMEADGSFRYQQMNAALVGLTLLSLYLYKEKRFFVSGFLICLVANIKLLPGLFLFGLCFPVNRKYIQGILAGIVLCLTVPLYVWGFDKTWAYHLDWFGLLLRDTQSDGILDVATVLKRYGFTQAKTWALYPISLVSLILFIIARIKPRMFDWDIWIPLGLLTLLLVSPRTESPTFVLAAPAYIFLLRNILKSSRPNREITLVLWGLGIFLTTLCMNDIWPRVVWNPASWLQANKTLGIFILWGLAVYSQLKLELK
jgi:hypothetical protein